MLQTARAAILIAAAVLLAALSGCAPDIPPEARGRQVVEFWCGWTGHEAKVFQDLADRYNHEQARNYVRLFGGVQDDTKTVRAITAGVPPDACFLWNPAYLGPLAANGALRTFDERLPEAGLSPNDFIPASLELCRFRNRLYGLPVLIDGTALYWNRTLFREAGLDPDRPPRTPAELVECTRKLTARDSSGKLTRIGFEPTDDLTPFLFAERAPLVDASGRPAADTPPVRAALAWYRDLYDAMGKAEEVDGFAAGFGQAQSPLNPFFTGKCAIMVSGEWMPYWIARWAPGLDYGVTAFPSGLPGTPPACGIGGNVVCIPSQSRHPDAAWDFIAWLQRRDTQRRFARGIYNLPNRRDMLADRALTQGSRAARGYATLLQLAASPGARPFPNLTYASVYLTELTNARDFVAQHAKTVEEAARDLQRRMDREAEAAGGAGT